MHSSRDAITTHATLLYGISDGLLMKLQTLQIAAVRVVTGTKKFDHITPVPALQSHTNTKTYLILS